VASDPVQNAKIKAGMLLSKFLRNIAEEETELVVDPEDGDRMATKAEALARKMWKIALGYEETTDSGTVVKHSPDRAMMSLIYTRLEGRAPASVVDPNHNLTAAGKVSEQVKHNIEMAGKLDMSRPPE